MNTRRRTFSACLLWMISACSQADSPTSDPLALLCENIKHGNFELSSVAVSDPHTNAYLFSCTVAVVIAGPSPVSGPHTNKNNLKPKKIALANHLLAGGVDIRFSTNEDENLLMAVVASFMPEQWKADTVEALLKIGVDPAFKSKNGDTALDMANYKGDKRIIQLLSRASPG